MLGVPKLYKRSCWGTKTFCHMLPVLKSLVKYSKILFTLVSGIKNNYSLKDSYYFSENMFPSTLILKNHLFLKLQHAFLQENHFFG